MSQPGAIFIIVLLLGVAALAWVLRFIFKAHRSAAWPLMLATVVESTVVQQGNTRSPRLKFLYQVADRPYVGRRLWVGPSSISVSGGWADRVASRYPVQAAVRVAVDPADAAYAVLEPGLRAVHWLALTFVLVIFGGTLVADALIG